MSFTGGWREWRAAVADGWTVHAAAALEARRLAARTGADRDGRSKRRRRRRISGPRPRSERRHRRPAGTRRSRPARRPAARKDRLSKDAYRRQKTAIDAELTRLGLRKSQLELSIGIPAIAANFVEMRRATSELADVSRALTAAEDAWLDLEDRAP